MDGKNNENWWKEWMIKRMQVWNEWMKKQKDEWTKRLKAWNDWMVGQKNERKESMNKPKEWDFGNFRKVKFEMMNLCKVGIGKMTTSYLPLSNAMTRKTNGHICYLSSSLFLQK